MDVDLFSVTETGRGRMCRGPLDVLSAIVLNVEANTSLRYELTRTVDDIRQRLEIREEKGLEYLFAHALLVGCVRPAVGGDAVYEWLLDKFQSFDRRQLNVTVMLKKLPLVLREAQVERLRLQASNSVELIRAFHLARAIDADGPHTRNVEKDAILQLMIRVLTGFDASALLRAA